MELKPTLIYVTKHKTLLLVVLQNKRKWISLRLQALEECFFFLVHMSNTHSLAHTTDDGKKLFFHFGLVSHRQESSSNYDKFVFLKFLALEAYVSPNIPGNLIY